MQNIEVKFGDWLQKGFELYKDNMATLLLAGLFTMVLSMITVGVLAGPMLIGMCMVTLAIVDRTSPKPQPGDVFKGMNQFVPALLYFLTIFIVSLVGGLILAFIPCIGTILSTLFSFALGTATMFAPFYMADRKMDFVPAIQTSWERVRPNFWPFLGLYAVASLLGSLGMIACCIGIIVTLPYYFCVIAIAYRDLSVEAAIPTPPDLGTSAAG